MKWLPEPRVPSCFPALRNDAAACTEAGGATGSARSSRCAPPAPSGTERSMSCRSAASESGRSDALSDNTHGVHAAADVHTHRRRNDGLVRGDDGSHRRPDSGVDVGHHRDAMRMQERQLRQVVELPARAFLHIVRPDVDGARPGRLRGLHRLAKKEAGLYRRRPCPYTSTDGGLTSLRERSMIAWLGMRTPFPPIAAALAEPNGLLAAGGDLSPDRLLVAYRSGIFPWYSEGQPILWWSPDPRMVLYVDELRVSRSLRKRVRARRVRGPHRHGVSRGHRGVRRVPRDGPARHLDHAGHRARLLRAASPRLRAFRGKLARRRAGRRPLWRLRSAGCSSASRCSRAKRTRRRSRSCTWSRGCAALDVPLIDCQQETGHLAALGARPIARDRFAAHLAQLIHSIEPPPGWHRRASGAQTRDREQAQRPAADLAPVLRDRAVSLQLPGRSRRALPGRHPQPPHRYPRLQRARSARIPAERGLHLPAVLRPLPGLRPGTGARGQRSSPTGPSARSREITAR